jgi:selenocysteine lyase/cysteine desulfurase
MCASRRNFLKNGAAGLAGVLAYPQFSSSQSYPNLAKQTTPVSATDEKFWQQVRAQFPLNKNSIYLNNGTMGPSPYSVIEAVHKGMMEGDVNGAYGGWENTQATLAKFVGVNENEIALTRNVTDGINIVCWGLPLKRGDEVIMSTHEHVGNAFPWLTRQRLDGIVIKAVNPGQTTEQTLANVKAAYTKKTKAIAFPHIPCTQGQIFPAKEICQWAKSMGLFAFIDGAHGPGMMPIDLHDMGCDAYASCSHKWMLGPKGTGFLYVRKEFQNTLQAKFVGGGSDNAKWNMATQPIQTGDYADSAHRYYGGSQSLGLYKGVEAAIQFIETIGMQSIYERIAYLGKYTQEQLLSCGNKVELLTPTEASSRCAVNGFRIKGVEINDFYKTCAENKIRIRVVHENGLNSLRVSTHIYNNTQEVDALIELVKKAVG